jgi:HIRAN domain
VTELVGPALAIVALWLLLRRPTGRRRFRLRRLAHRLSPKYDPKQFRMHGRFAYPRPSYDDSDADRFDQEVHGESHHLAELEDACGGRTREGVDLRMKARLVLEDSNPIDSNAVRVEIKGRHVGYIPREEAPFIRKAYAEAFTSGGCVECDARIRGGWNRPRGDVGDFGVTLALPDVRH